MEFNPLNWSQNYYFPLLKMRAKDGGDSKACLPSVGHTGTHLSALDLEAGRPCREDSEEGFSETVTVALCRGREAVWWGGLPVTASSPSSRLLELPLARLRL